MIIDNFNIILIFLVPLFLIFTNLQRNKFRKFTTSSKECSVFIALGIMFIVISIPSVLMSNNINLSYFITFCDKSGKRIFGIMGGAYGSIIYGIACYIIHKAKLLKDKANTEKT